MATPTKEPAAAPVKEPATPKAKPGTADMTTNLAEDMERFSGKRKELEIHKLFRALVKLEGSDLHLKAGRPPFVRVNGTLRPMNRGPSAATRSTRPSRWMMCCTASAAAQATGCPT